MRVSFLNTLPKEEWERYQSNRSDLEPSDLHGMNMDMIRRYGTQSVMKVGLNQPIMREVLDKLMSSLKSDVLSRE